MVTMADSGQAAARLEAPAGRVRVHTLMTTRWVAIAGQAAAAAVVHWLVGISLPIAAIFGTIAMSVALNLWLWRRRGSPSWHSDRQAAGYLAYDIVQLSLLLYFTGGLANPFSVLLLVPVTISATILSLRSTIGLGLLAFVSISLLSVVNLDLNWPPPGLDLPPIYILGVWASEVTGTAFLMFYAWRVAEEARRMADALSATQMALSRERELSSLGALAAATAHELGTPLSTIALVSKELLRSRGIDASAREDVVLLNSEVARCREILALLARNPGSGVDRNAENMPFEAMLVHIAEVHKQDNVRFNVTLDPEMKDGSEPAPVIRRSPEIIQGLGNLIENAAEFARREVRLEMYWSAQILRLVIMDDGRGFPRAVLGAIGEPYISTRPERGRMGLGLFISKTLLERTGADIRFANRQDTSGATVVITWPRGIIETTPKQKDPA